MSTTAAPTLSAVICCFNEEPNIDELLRRVSASFEATIGPAWEIILVDDGSRSVALRIQSVFRDWGGNALKPTRDILSPASHIHP